MSEPIVIRRPARPRPETPEPDRYVALCEHCGKALSVAAGGKVKVRTSLIAFRKDGTAEIPCPHCHRDTRLPGVVLRQDPPMPPSPTAP